MFFFQKYFESQNYIVKLCYSYLVTECVACTEKNQFFTTIGSHNQLSDHHKKDFEIVSRVEFSC